MAVGGVDGYVAGSGIATIAPFEFIAKNQLRPQPINGDLDGTALSLP